MKLYMLKVKDISLDGEIRRKFFEGLILEWTTLAWLGEREAFKILTELYKHNSSRIDWKETYSFFPNWSILISSYIVRNQIF